MRTKIKTQMNVHITPETMDHVLECIVAARDEVNSTS